MRVACVVGARPNLMKMAPILEAMKAGSMLEPFLIHTGQHYDYEMDKVFFEELDIPEPDVYLGVGSGTHSVQTAAVMTAIELVLQTEKPDLVLVVGDVNSTLAAALVAAKMCIPVAHVEAGLRSGDRTMPEEINRVVTDHVSDYLFTHCEDGDRNLEREGIPSDKVHLVGNVMIDSLVRCLDKAGERDILARLGLEGQSYGILTLHRPSNVDDEDSYRRLLSVFQEIAREMPVVYPVHPRAKARIAEFGLREELGLSEQPGRLGPPEQPPPGERGHVARANGLLLTEPLGYLDFLRLTSQAAVVFTDSGGLQEETTYLGVPCVTLRENTERPITLAYTNVLAGTDPAAIMEAFRRLKPRASAACSHASAQPISPDPSPGPAPQTSSPDDSPSTPDGTAPHPDETAPTSPHRTDVPPLWDGHAAERICAILATVAPST